MPTTFTRPSLHQLPPHDHDSPRPPRIMRRAAVLLGSKTQLARLCNVRNDTVTKWMKNGYPYDAACKVHFLIGLHIKELQEFQEEAELALLKHARKRGYTFPPDEVYIKTDKGEIL